MPTNLLVTFYSTYGHIHRMARAVVEGAESVPDTTVRLRRIPELEEARRALSAQDAYVQAQQTQAEIAEVTHDDLRWADGIAWGTPTRYGNMSAQMKQFVDTTGSLWLKGELEDKATGSLRARPASTAGKKPRSSPPSSRSSISGSCSSAPPTARIRSSWSPTALAARPMALAVRPEPMAPGNRSRWSSPPPATSEPPRACPGRLKGLRASGAVAS